MVVNGVPIFPKVVANNTLKASNIAYIFSGLLNIVGSFLVTKK